MRSTWNTYLVPGLVYQSIVVGGGYGTGREVTEFISKGGPWGGTLGLLLIGVLMSVVFSATYNFARLSRSSDYRSFFRSLLGRFWVTYELAFTYALILVLAVTGAAAGTIIEMTLGLNSSYGVLAIYLLIVVSSFLDRRWVERSLAGWSIFLSAVLVTFAAAALMTQGAESLRTFSEAHTGTPWLSGALKFFMYNVFLFPVALYAAHDINTRRQACIAGIIAAALTVLPGWVFHFIFMARYPEVLGEALPTFALLQDTGSAFLLGVYVVALLGTIVQTGVGVLHGINRRIDRWLTESRRQPLGAAGHGAVAAICIALSVALASFGVIALIAKGYGSMAWVSLLIYIIPILTIGIYRQCKPAGRSVGDSGPESHPQGDGLQGGTIE